VKKVLFALLTFAIGATALPTGNTAYARGDVVTLGHHRQKCGMTNPTCRR
jgi:hypothetical protein